MAIHSLQHTEPATQHTLLIAGADQARRTFLAGQLDADGHTVYEADHQATGLAKLACHAIGVLILGELERPFEAPALARSVRAGEHERVHPGLPVITLGADDELSATRGRKEAQRILTDLLEEIHELPDALAAAIASQHPD